VKSLAVVGKGHSVNRCTKKFIDSFGEVAICNFPPMDGYEHLISNRADYHFFNAGDPLPYAKSTLNNLKLKKVFNTSIKDFPVCPASSLPDHDVQYYSSFGLKNVKVFQRFGFGVRGASTGIQALLWAIETSEYDKIALVGFDFHARGQKVYYFGIDETNPSLRYLFDGNTYSADGVVVSDSTHGSFLSAKFVVDMANQYPHIEFIIFSNFSFSNFITPPNLNVR
jgi:hypothetical protein